MAERSYSRKLKNLIYDKVCLNKLHLRRVHHVGVFLRKGDMKTRLRLNWKQTFYFSTLSKWCFWSESSPKVINQQWKNLKSCSEDNDCNRVSAVFSLQVYPDTPGETTRPGNQTNLLILIHVLLNTGSTETWTLCQSENLELNAFY